MTESSTATSGRRSAGDLESRIARARRVHGQACGFQLFAVKIPDQTIFVDQKDSFCVHSHF